MVKLNPVITGFFSACFKEKHFIRKHKLVQIMILSRFYNRYYR